MSDVVVRARKVFEEEFIAAFEKHAGATNWAITFSAEEAERLSMTWTELSGAIDFLKRKGLIERLADEAWQLTDFGVDACADVSLLDEILPLPVVP